MPSFADSIFLFVLALLLFGPKKLPVLARELGKWMGEFRRASNEFKMQMDEELRAAEQTDRKQQIAAMEAAAPVPPRIQDPAEEVHPHMRFAQAEPATEASVETAPAAPSPVVFPPEPAAPLPIATAGSLQMMPPDTGLPMARSGRGNALSGLVESIPEASAAHSAAETEGASHGH